MLENIECPDQQSYRELLQSAIAHLSRREHSVLELQNKLRKKFKVGEERGELALARVLEKVIEDGYLSDQRYAEAFIRTRTSKGYGFDRISNELGSKGVDAELITAMIEQFKALGSERDLILKVWEKKYCCAPRDFNEKLKQMRFLHHRGFKLENIQLFISELEVAK